MITRLAVNMRVSRVIIARIGHKRPPWEDRCVTEFLTSLGNSVGVWLYVIAGGLAFAEAAILVGMVLPGETALLVAGYFCHQGVLDLRIMIVVAVVCAVTGDSVGYEFGKKFGPSLRRSRLGHWVGEPRWTRVDAFLHKHGGKAVLFGRLTAILRALMPSIAGMSGMRYRTFLVWNAAGGLIWGSGCVLLGYAFASALGRVEKYLTWAPLAVLAALIVGYIALEIRKRRREKSDERDYAETHPESDSAHGSPADGGLPAIGEGA
jgi:membrane-associated protein